MSEVGRLTGLRVCRFGSYDSNYSRNVIIDKCLKRAGADIVEVRDHRSLAVRTPRLVGRALRERFDVILVGFRAHSDMLSASLLARVRGVPLIFDPLLSRYEEKVVDRQLVQPRSWLARWYRLSDACGCRLADTVLLETDTQAAYFARTFSMPASRFRRVWLGADDEVMYPRQSSASSASTRPFTVFFYGRFSPLHGVEHIIRAAAILQQRADPVRFVLVGAGQMYTMARELADRIGVDTIEFVPPVPYADLAVMMSEADVCLGSFGTTARAQRVIPNKVFDALAVRRPVLTADTPAVREVLAPGEHVWVCPPGDAEGLADAIALLKRDPDLRRSLADQGYQRFAERFSLAAIARELGEIVSHLLQGNIAHSLPR